MRKAPGLVALVSQGDEVHVESIGTPGFDNPAPMKRDTIFRIASLTHQCGCSDDTGG
jgi:hypothetical protein